jgi:chromosome segregation ATPase
MNEHKFIRDDGSNAILNTNINALEQYKVERIRRKKEQSILQDCVDDINSLKDDMQEIKNLLIKMSEN